MPIKLTTDAFILKAETIHSNHNYDYSNVIYKTTTYPVCIICNIHGEFYQRPNNHLNGAGCPKCGLINRLNIRRDSNENFIKKSNIIHNKKYDYSESVYGKNNLEKVTITCKLHGRFLQSPSDHLDGCGCPKCGRDSSMKSRTKTTYDFIKDARLVWENIYDYSKSNYINCNKKIIITCKTHGDFLQSPSNHINCEQGCPKCELSKGEAKILLFLDKRGIHYIRQYWFDGCRSKFGKKQVLRFDFFIPSKNLLIEYNGKQHYKLKSFVNGKHHISSKEFRDIKIRDKIKKEYVTKHKIDFLIIKYTKINQIEKILEEKLNTKEKL